MKKTAMSGSWTGLSVLLVLLFTVQSCSEDDTITEPVEIVITDPQDDLDEDETDDPIEEPEGFTPLGTVQVFDENKIEDSYILVNNAGANRIFLMDKEARLIYEWNLADNIGNDVFLLPNGKLLGSMEVEDPLIKLGGQGGQLQLISADGSVDWQFVHSSLDGETHHDAEILPNGNILAMVWQRLPAETSIQAGFALDTDVFPESIIEIDPNTNEIVWEWHSWNHLIQDHDDTKDNYGIVSEHPELIDLNYVVKSESTADIKGDIMHANAIAYDEKNDVILLSVNFFSEVWAIDHSTSKEEAASHSGGNYGRGGDLIYRFGNPEAYMNSSGNRLFNNNHFPNLLKGENEGKLLIFSNGNDVGRSTVFELELPSAYDLRANENNELKVTWSFTDPELYSPKVSGAVPLPNGNVLITEGDFGFWEVTRDKEVVWKFNAPGFYWRGYHYSKDAPEVLSLGF